jgi:hypothetical protein
MITMISRFWALVAAVAGAGTKRPDRARKTAKNRGAVRHHREEFMHTLRINTHGSIAVFASTYVNK